MQLAVAEGEDSALKCTLPYPPSVNNLYYTVGRRRVLSKEGRAFKETAGKRAFKAGVTPIMSGDVKVTINLYRPARRGDLDNSMKCLLDSLKGIAWTDDAQVKRIEAERHEDKENPRAEVVIEEMGVI